MDQRISGVALCLLMLLCLLPFSSLPFLPPPSPDLSWIKGFQVGPCVSRCFCVCCHSLPSPPPSSFRPIMDQRIKVWPCVSRCFCVCYHSLPSPSSPPPPTYYESKDFRCGLVSLDASVSAAILFPPLPFYESPFFLRREVTQPSTHSSSKQSVISPFLNC